MAQPQPALTRLGSVLGLDLLLIKRSEGLWVNEVIIWSPSIVAKLQPDEQKVKH